VLLLIKVQLYPGYPLPDPSWITEGARSLAGVLRGFPAELLVLVGGAFLWWRGWHTATREVSFTTIVTGFQFGVVTLLLVLFLASFTEAAVGNAYLLVLAFLGFALASMAMARSQETVGRWTGIQRRRWTGLLLVSTGLVLLLGILVGALVTADLLQLLVAALGWMWGLLVKAFVFLANLWPASELPEPLPGTPSSAGEEEALRQGIRDWLPRIFRQVGGYAVIGTMTVLLVLAMWQISSQVAGWLRRMLTVPKGTVEPLSGAFREDILALLRGLAKALLSIILVMRGWLGWRRRASFPQGAASVRGVYRSMLRWAARAGWPRASSQTPYEYLRALEPQLATGKEHLEAITLAYVSTRYGCYLPGGEEPGRVRESWHILRRVRLRRPDKDAAITT